jgi:hypothetical protein
MPIPVLYLSEAFSPTSDPIPSYIIDIKHAIVVIERDFGVSRAGILPDGPLSFSCIATQMLSGIPRHDLSGLRDKVRLSAS